MRALATDQPFHGGLPHVEDQTNAPDAGGPHTYEVRTHLGVVIGHGSKPRADRVSRHVADRAAQRHHRPYDDAVVPKLHPDVLDYHANQPVHNQVAKHSVGNISGKALHKDKWAHYASRNSEQHEHKNAANVDRPGSVARHDGATGHLAADLDEEV
jgi:hypothetical protein